MLKTVLNSVHNQAVFKRRVRVIAAHIAQCIDENENTILDIGCGDGSIDVAILCENPELSIRGVDVMARENSRIPTTVYDGVSLPFDDSSFDSVILIDVLHHTDRPQDVLAEAERVSRSSIIIKDHLCENKKDFALLKFMDWVGNKGHDVRLPYNYLSRAQWETIFTNLSLQKKSWNEALELYTQPLESVFGGDLHFISRLERGSATEQSGLFDSQNPAQ